MRPKSYAPQHRVNSADVAGPGDWNTELRGDNTTGWEARARPLVYFLETGSKELRQIKDWARRERHQVNVIEEALYWLEARGRVERGDDRKWRLVS